MHTKTKTTATLKMTGISTNYLKKIQEAIALDEELRGKLAQFHNNMGLKTPPYLLKMDNPRLTVSISRHNTIMAALFEAMILTGNFNIHFYERILTLQECEAIRSCEEGELDAYKGCSVERAREVHELRVKAEWDEIEPCEEKDEDDEFNELFEEAEHDEELQERLEMWLEKMDRPGRKLARGSDESAADILLRHKAMRKIEKMSAREFQTRLLDGTLPDFPREKPPTGLIRDTCHEMRLLTVEEFDNPNRASNYAEHHKSKLRYMSAEVFKYASYKEFNQ